MNMSTVNTVLMTTNTTSTNTNMDTSMPMSMSMVKTVLTTTARKIKINMIRRTLTQNPTEERKNSKKL